MHKPIEQHRSADIHATKKREKITTFTSLQNENEDKEFNSVYTIKIERRTISTSLQIKNEGKRVQWHTLRSNKLMMFMSPKKT